MCQFKTNELYSNYVARCGAPVRDVLRMNIPIKFTTSWQSGILSTYMMLERFGNNLTVTTSDISKLTHFPPEYCCCTIHYWCTRRKNCSNLCQPTEGWMEVLAQKSEDGYILNLLFSSGHIISYYIDFPHNPF